MRTRTDDSQSDLEHGNFVYYSSAPIRYSPAGACGCPATSGGLTSSSVIIIFGQPELELALISNINTVNINTLLSSLSQSPIGGGNKEVPGFIVIAIVGPDTFFMRPKGIAALTAVAIPIQPLIQLESKRRSHMRMSKSAKWVARLTRHVVGDSNTLMPVISADCTLTRE